MATLVATADPTTGTVLIDVSQATLIDTFTRVVAGGWGNATPSGQLWTTSGGAAGDYSVNGTQGLHTVNTTIVGRHSTTTLAVGADMGIQTFVTIPVLALTQPFSVNTLVRFTSTASNYFARISIAPTNVATLILGKNVLGVMTPLGTVVLGQTHAAGATWVTKIDVCGSRLRAKAWRNTVLEPDWLLTANDFGLTTGTDGGVRSVLDSGNTNGSVAFAYDNFFSFVGSGLRLYRVTPDGVRTEVRGSPFNTPTQNSGNATATIWDNEAPLDVALTYVLTSNCSTTVNATSNSVTLTSSGDGWLRDPTNPSNNIRISFADTQFDECNSTNRVVMTDWDARVYRNASGQFDILNSQRPTTVSMRRKRYDSSMFFASKTLTDVDDLEALIAPGSILLLSLPAQYGFGRPYGSDYITVQDVVQGPVDTDDYQTPFRAWEVPFMLSPEPVDTNEGLTGSNGIGGGGATYADMTASAIGVTYATTTATGETYQQLAQGVGY
jgi:hypothetical protein